MGQAQVCPECRVWFEGRGRWPRCPACGYKAAPTIQWYDLTISVILALTGVLIIVRWPTPIGVAVGLALIAVAGFLAWLTSFWREEVSGAGRLIVGMADVVALDLFGDLLNIPDLWLFLALGVVIAIWAAGYLLSQLRSRSAAEIVQALVGRSSD